MDLEIIFPDGIITEDGIYLNWAGLDFPESAIPSGEHFLKAVMFQYSKVVPTENFFRFSEHTMSIVSVPAQQVSADGLQFLRTGWNISFLHGWSGASLDPSRFGDDVTAPSPTPTPVPVPTPVPTVEPWVEYSDATVNASVGEMAWLNTGVTNVVLPSHFEGSKVSLFNDTGSSVDIEDIPGTLTIPDQELIILSSESNEWVYTSNPGTNLSLFIPEPEHVLLTLDSLATDAHGTRDLFDYLGDLGGSTTWSNPSTNGQVGVANEGTYASADQATLTNKQTEDWWAIHGPNKVIQFDFDYPGVGRTVKVTQLAFGYSNQPASYAFETFELYRGVGTSLSDVEWELIGQFSNPGMSSAAANAYGSVIDINDDGEPYRFLRIKLPDLNLGGVEWIQLGEVKLGGKLYANGSGNYF